MRHKPDYLLDTNIVSDLVRHPQGSIAQRIAKIGEAHIAISLIVAAELRFGAAKSPSQRIKQQVDAILAVITILPLTAPVDQHYADIRLTLEKAGHVIGPNDMLIAAHARSLGRILVTANLREFKRVPELHVENWLD